MVASVAVREGAPLWVAACTVGAARFWASSVAADASCGGSTELARRS